MTDGLQPTEEDEGTDDPLLDACYDVVDHLQAATKPGQSVAAVAVVWIIHTTATSENDCAAILSHSFTRNQLLHMADTLTALAEDAPTTATH